MTSLESIARAVEKISVKTEDIPIIKSKTESMEKHMGELNGRVGDIEKEQIQHIAEVNVYKKMFYVLAVPVVMLVLARILSVLLR